MSSFLQMPAGLGIFLKQVQMGLITDPNYLDRIPDPEVAAILKRAFIHEPVVEGAGASKFEGKDEYEVILADIQDTMVELDKLLDGANLEPSDRIQFVKAKTALLERWSAQKEKIWNIRSMAEFQQTVVKFMEDVLADHVDLRTEFIRRMKALKTIGR